MLIPALISLAFLIPGLIYPSGYAATAGKNKDHKSVDLAQTDSIEVLLFSGNPPGAVKLWSWNGPLILRTQNGDTLVQESDQQAIQIYRKGRYVFYDNGQHHVITRKVTVITEPGVLIRMKATGYPYRYYRGVMTFTTNRARESLHIVNKTSLEDYVGSVVGSEMDFINIEALKAQAVIARTYALWHLGDTHGTDYDVRDNTQNQIYKGELIMKPYCREVALATKGEILTWSHHLILAAYSSTCGGQTASNVTVWGGHPLPYLKPVKDNGACADSPHYRWTFQIGRDSLLLALRHALKRPVNDIAGLDTSEYGRITFVHLKISPKHDRRIKGTLFREILLNEFGERSLKSNWYTLQKGKNMYIFHGRGMGHGVGLCQWGARGLALTGWNYREILRFYYTGVKIEELFHFKEQNLPLAY